MSTEQSVLRTTLLGSLLDVAQRNRARGAATVRLFEAGAVYLPDRGALLPREPYHLGALLTGAARPPSWRDGAARRVDFFAAKGVLAALLDALRVPWTSVRARASRSCIPAGRRASWPTASPPAGSGRSIRWSRRSGSWTTPWRRSSSISTWFPCPPTPRSTAR